MTEARPRPGQVTVATCLGAIGALLFVVSLFDVIEATRSVAMRDSRTDAELDLIRAAVFAGGVVAAVAFVFAIYLRQGHKGARIGFTVAAGLLLPGLVIPAGVSLGAMLLGISLSLLWSRPVRVWFGDASAIAATEAAARTAASSESGQARPMPPFPPVPPPPSAAPPTPPPPPSAAPPTAPPPPSYQYVPPPAPAYASAPPPQVQAPVPVVSEKRPRSLMWAAILTWVASSIVAVVSVLAIVVLSTDRESLLDDVEEQIQGNSSLQELSISANQLLDMVVVAMVVVLLWCAAACVLALLMLLRMNWARILLAISTAGSALFSLVAILSIAPVVSLVASVAVLVMLFSARSNAWFARRPQSRGPSAPAPPRHQVW